MGDQPVPHDEDGHRDPGPVDRPVDCRPYRGPPTKAPASIGEGSQAQVPSTSAKVGDRAALPAAVGSCRYRPILQGQDPQGGGRQVLVVRGRKEIDPTPPIHRVQGLAPPDHEAMEGHREGVRVESPKGPLSQVALEEEGHGGGVKVPAGHQGGVRQHQGEAPEGV